MARFLFCPIPFSGHVNPGLPIAQELVRRGHDVVWYTTPRFREAVVGVGARYLPVRAGTVIDEATLAEQFPARTRLRGIAQLKHDLKHIFIDLVPGALEDIETEIAREPIDGVIGDCAAGVAALVRERHGVPWIAYGVTVYACSSRDTAPFGLALMPSATRWGRLRNRALALLVDKIVFKETHAHFQAKRGELGFPPSPHTLFDIGRDADLYLQSSIEELEYPRSDLPDNVAFVGVFAPAAPEHWTPPAWWPELDGDAPVVLVTQGTIANDFDDLIRPAIRALADAGVLVVVTTGSRPASDVGIDPLPANVRVERHIPYAHLMEKVDVLVTNGGYGAVQLAIASGVPVVACGGSEDKPEIANRIEWSGVGRGVRVQRPGEHRIRALVDEVLGDRRFRDRAASLSKKIAALHAPTRAADLVERMLPGCSPSPRSHSPTLRHASVG